MATTKKRSPRLGKGLSSLMATPVAVAPAAPAPADTPPASEHAATSQPSPDVPRGTHGLASLALSSITTNADQPRQQFDTESLDSLAQSIRDNGVMQPIIVRPASESGKEGGAAYMLVAGERRWRAAQLAEINEIPAIVQELSDQQVAEWALIENLQREDLNPMEHAEAFERLGTEFSLSHDDIASHVGLKRSSVTNFLRLLTLSQPVRQMVRDGLLSMGQSRAITGITDEEQQLQLARKTVKEGLSVRQVEALTRQINTPSTTPTSTSGNKPSAYLADLEQQIGDQLKTRVKIQAGRKKGSGSMTIEFYSLEQFDALVDRLGCSTE